MTEIIWQPESGPEQVMYGDFNADEVAEIIACAETPSATDPVLLLPLRLTPDGRTWNRLLPPSRIVAVDGRRIQRRDP